MKLSYSNSKSRKRGNSADSSWSMDMLNVNTIKIDRQVSRTTMIFKLENDEVGYENRKTIFRKRLESGVLTDNKHKMYLDKGAFMKKYNKILNKTSGWILYLYKKLNWWNQHFHGKYHWCGSLNTLISDKMAGFIGEQERLYKNFMIYNKNFRASDTERKATWKGIETSGLSYHKLSKVKEHFDSSSHPLNKIILKFQNSMIKANKFLLNPLESSDNINFMEVKERIIDDIYRFISLMYFTTIKFYNLDIKDNDNNTDILIEIITDRVIRDDFYTLLHNVISYWLKREIKRLNQKMIEEDKYDFENSRFLAGISGIFSFSNHFKLQRIGMGNQTPSIYGESVYIKETETRDEKTKLVECVKLLHNLKNIQNPIEKVQMLAKVVDRIKKEVDDFWDGIDMNPDEKWIDAYNMEKLLSYVVLKSKYQKIVVDLQIIDLFSGNFIDYCWNGFIFASFSHTVNGILNQKDKDHELSEVNTPFFNNHRFKEFRKNSESSSNSSDDEISTTKFNKLDSKTRAKDDIIVLSNRNSKYFQLHNEEIMNYSKSLLLQACH